MPQTLDPAHLVNQQQIEVVVSGPDGANRMWVIDGTAKCKFYVTGDTMKKETYSFHVGPSLTRRQFHRAIATASLADIQLFTGPFAQPSDIDPHWINVRGLRERCTSRPRCSGSGAAR